MREMGLWIILIGIFIFFTGAILYTAPALFKWFGNLPGDIKYEGKNIKIYIPLITMLIISILLTILINVVFFILKNLKR